MERELSASKQTMLGLDIGQFEVDALTMMQRR